MSHILIPRATTLVQLAQEHLYLMLFSLDAYDLVRVRQTCKALKAIVDNSEMPQYVIDLSYFQMIPVGTSDIDMPPAIRRKRLRHHDAAWQHFEYKQEYTLPLVMLETTLELSGGVYGIGIVGKDCISLTRLPSATDFNDLHCWSCPVDTTTSVDFHFPQVFRPVHFQAEPRWKPDSYGRYPSEVSDNERDPRRCSATDPENSRQRL